MIEKTQSFINSELSVQDECTNSVPKLIADEELTDNLMPDKQRFGHIKKELKTVLTILSSLKLCNML